MVNTTTSIREIFSKLRALAIQSYLGYNAFEQITHNVSRMTRDEWKEAVDCCDISMRAQNQLMELKKELYLLLNGHPYYEFFYDELAALSKKYSSHGSYDY